MEHEVVPEGFVPCRKCVCHCFTNHAAVKRPEKRPREAKACKRATVKVLAEVALKEKADGKLRSQASKQSEPQGLRTKAPELPPLTFSKAVAQSTVADTHACSLWIPLVYMREYGHRLGETVILEGKNGHKWEVGVSRGTWTGFRVGWKAFASAYNLEVGDVLEFTLTADSTFSVKVIDSKGKEKVGSAVGTTEMSAKSLGKRKVKEVELLPTVSMFSSNKLKCTSETEECQQGFLEAGIAPVCKRPRTKRFANSETESNVENLSQNKRVVPAKRGEQAVQSEESHKDAEAREGASVKRLRTSRSVVEILELTRESGNGWPTRLSDSEECLAGEMGFDDGGARPVEVSENMQRGSQTGGVPSGKDSSFSDSVEEAAAAMPSGNCLMEPETQGGGHGHDVGVTTSTNTEQLGNSREVACPDPQECEQELGSHECGLPFDLVGRENLESPEQNENGLDAGYMQGERQNPSNLVVSEEEAKPCPEGSSPTMPCRHLNANGREEQLANGDSSHLRQKPDQQRESRPPQRARDHFAAITYQQFQLLSNLGPRIQEAVPVSEVSCPTLTTCDKETAMMRTETQARAPLDLEVDWKGEEETHCSLSKCRASECTADSSYARLLVGERGVSTDLRLSIGIQ